MASPQRQKLPFSKKDKDWKKANVDYFAEKCLVPNDYMLRLYQAANGELDSTDYNYITNPYSKASKPNAKLRSFPAKLRNYPIIPNIINLLLGEKRDRPIISAVTISNNDVVNIKKKEFEKLQKNYLQQTYINELNRQGIDTKQDTQALPEYTKLVEDFEYNYNDMRVIYGQEAVDFFMQDLDIPEKFIEGFLDWLVVGSVFSVKDVQQEDLIYHIIKPYNVGYLADNSVQFIEDGQAACVRFNLSVSEFMDRFYDLIQEEGKSEYNKILDYLDSPEMKNGSSEGKRMVYTDEDMGSSTISGSIDLLANNVFSAEMVEVVYVNWQSWQEVYNIIRINPLGEQSEETVPSDYKIDEETEVQVSSKYWINQGWEGYKVDEKYYFGIRPIPLQRNKINKKSSNKLLINGRIKRVGDLRGLSTVEMLMPFQHLYNFGHYKLNLTVAKNKDKLLAMPMGLMPKKEGWDMATTMYHADATSILWIDDSNTQSLQTLNALKSIDLSLANYITFLYDYIRGVKTEAEELIGINSQRKGELKSSDGLGASQTAINRSSLITEQLFAEYDKFQETELNGLLDLSKIAWIHGKKASYISSDGRIAYLNIDKENESYASAEFGVRIVNSTKERDKYNKMVAFAEKLATQGQPASVIAQILDSETSFNKLVSKLKQIEKLEKESQQAQEQAQQDHEMQMQQMQQQSLQEERDLAYYKIDQDNITKKEVALINSDTTLMGADLGTSTIDASDSINDRALKRDELLQKNSIELAKLRVETDKYKTDAQTKKYVSDNQLKIAKENKQKADRVKSK